MTEVPRRGRPSPAAMQRQLLGGKGQLLGGQSRAPLPVPTVVPTTTGIPSLVDVEHGDDPNVARPVARKVFWIGAATPNNAAKSDFWYPSNDL